jgi:hypothetical protein
MSSDLLVLIELLLILGLVMWFCVGQLRSLKKLKTESRKKAAATESRGDTRK